MSERTIEDALAHAETCTPQHCEWWSRDDLLLLADEVKRLREENDAMRPSRFMADAPKVGEIVSQLIERRDVEPLESLFQQYGYLLTDEPDSGLRVGEWNKFKADLRGVVNALREQLQTENYGLKSQVRFWKHAGRDAQMNALLAEIDGLKSGKYNQAIVLTAER